MGRRDEDVELELALHHETAAAYLVSELGERDRAVFIPKSQCALVRTTKTVEESDKERDKKYPNRKPSIIPVVNVTCPEWIASSKGLL